MVGLVNGRAGSRPCTHNAPLFQVGEVSLPWLEKENVCDWLSMGNIGLLMLVCSNVRIIGGFPIFCVTFDAAVWDSLEARGLYRRLAGWWIPLCHWLLLVFQRGDMVRCCRVLSV